MTTVPFQKARAAAGSMIVQKKKPLMVPPGGNTGGSTEPTAPTESMDHRQVPSHARSLMLGESPLNAMARLMTSKTGNFSLGGQQMLHAE